MSMNDLPTRRAAAATIGARAGSGTTLTPAPKRFIRARRLWCRIVGHDLYSVTFRGGLRVSDCERCDLHIHEDSREYFEEYRGKVARRG